MINIRPSLTDDLGSLGDKAKLAVFHPFTPVMTKTGQTQAGSDYFSIVGNSTLCS
jgi:hypothetical protein